MTAALGVVVLGMTGCSSSSGSGSHHTDSGTPTGTTAMASAPATSTTGSSTTGGGDKLIDVCAALTAARASAIVGKRFTSAKGNTAAGVIAMCEYDGGLDLLQVTVTTSFGEHELQNDVDALTQVGHPPTKIAGVGDDAFSEPNPNGNAGAEGAADSASYGAVFGNTYIKVGGMWVTPAEGQQIVELVHAAQ